MHNIQVKALLKRSFAILGICIMLAALLGGCASKKVDDPLADVKTYKDLNDPKYRVGVCNGTTEGAICEEVIPKAQRLYYNSYVDLLTAVESHKVDAIVGDDMTWIYYNVQTGGKIRILDGFLKPYEFGYIFSKKARGKELRDQLNEFLGKLEAEGTLEEITHIWMDESGARTLSVDYKSLPAKNGVVKVATTSTGPPFTYIENGIITGLDIDVISRFCQEYGYGLEVTDMQFDGLIPAVSTGKYDIGASAITITDERKESVDFSEPYYFGGTTAAVYNVNYGSDKSFPEKIKDSFRKTFIKEHRYRLFISGIIVTLLITLLSALFGTLLGFAVYMLCRNGNRAANAVTKICVRIIQMLPVIVMLMIFYYIVFANAPVSGAFVSTIVFSLTFGASVFGMLTSSINTIDRGQTEAAYALGFSNLRTFFKIVLPQAMKFFLPSYKSELVALIKATAVVGYIAVQDLTRVGDIVRSRTYEAFFPIISVAVIYFIMAWILILIVDRIEIKIDPKRRKRDDILKGVKTND